MDDKQLKDILQDFTSWLEIGGFIQEDPNRTEQDWADQITRFLEQRLEPSECMVGGHPPGCQGHIEPPPQSRCRYSGCDKPTELAVDYCAQHHSYMILDWRKPQAPAK